MVHLFCIHVLVVAHRLMYVVLWLHWAGIGAKLVYVRYASCTRSWIFDACTTLAWYDAIHQTRYIPATPKLLLICGDYVSTVSLNCKWLVWWKSQKRQIVTLDWQYKNLHYLQRFSLKSHKFLCFTSLCDFASGQGNNNSITYWPFKAVDFTSTTPVSKKLGHHVKH